LKNWGFRATANTITVGTYLYALAFNSHVLDSAAGRQTVELRTACQTPPSAVRQAVIYQLSARQTSAHRQEHPACSARKCGARSMLLMWTGDDECGIRWCLLTTASVVLALTNRVGLHRRNWTHPQGTWLVTCSASTLYDT
jgi:hypothetical protein